MGSYKESAHWATKDLKQKSNSNERLGMHPYIARTCVLTLCNIYNIPISNINYLLKAN